MIKNYFRTALRNLQRHKGYAAINIFGLACGLAAFWMIALYVADELSYDRYNLNARRIARVVQHARWNDNEMNEAPTSAPFAPALKSYFPEIEEATRIVTEGGGLITYNGKTINAGDIFFADSNVFDVFTWPFLYGDPKTALTSPQSIVLTQGLAVKLFGGAEKALSQTIYFENNFPNQVTGVIKDIPQNSHLQFSALRSLPSNYNGGWQNFNLYTYLLFKPGSSRKNIESQLPQFAAETIQKFMRINDYRIELQPLTAIHLHSNLEYEISANGSISRIYMFMAIAALILFIAVINYINLSTARAASRIREVGVRKTIGSGRRHLIGMFIAESVLITLFAATIAICLVYFVFPFFNELTGKTLSIWRFGSSVTLLFLGGFALLTGVVCGIYPALFLSRFKTIPALRGQMGNLSANILFRKSLVIFQFAVTLIMIVGSLVIYRQLQYALHKDLGFNKEQVLTFHLHGQEVRTKAEALKAKLLEHASIEAVAVAGNPIGNNDIGGMGYNFETNEGGFSTASTMAEELMIDAAFIPAMDIRIVEGRNFFAGEESDKYGAALVNETLVKKLGWKDPIGKRMKFRLEDSTILQRQVVGVVKDFHTYSLQHKVAPMVMVMPPEASMGDNLYVRIAKGKIREGVAYLNAVYRQFDKTNPVEYHFLNENFARQYAAEEKQGQIAFVFALLAVVIACLGLFGLARFTAEQRTKEIGIRKVLGASVSNIMQMLSAGFLKLVVIAVLIAFPIAWYVMNHWLQDFAYRIAMGWGVFVLAALMALLIAFATISTQAVKAALSNPVKSLRSE